MAAAWKVRSEAELPGAPTAGAVLDVAHGRLTVTLTWTGKESQDPRTLVAITDVRPVAPHSRPGPDGPRVRGAARQRGMSIIELMIGIVVSLLVGLAAAGSAMMFTASQRQGVGVGGTLVNVGTVLSALKNDSANAGLGFFGDDIFLCNSLNLSVGGTVIANSASFAPLRITQGATSDQHRRGLFDAGARGCQRAAEHAHPTAPSAELMSLLPVSVGPGRVAGAAHPRRQAPPARCAR